MGKREISEDEIEELTVEDVKKTMRSLKINKLYCIVLYLFEFYRSLQ